MRIGRYELTAQLGQGGAGTVYKAVDLHLGREVALKVLHALAQPVTARRFEREARALARVAHEHVVRVYDFGVSGATPYLVLELLEGESLEDRLAREGPLEALAAARIVLSLTRAVGACHAAGVLHRDLKPANVVLTSDGVRLTDFGLARDVDRGRPRSA